LPWLAGLSRRSFNEDRKPRRRRLSSVVLRRFFLRHFLFHDDPRKLHYIRRHFPVLAEGRLEHQFPVSDLSQRDISVTESGREFHERTMPEAKLPNAS